MRIKPSTILSAILVFVYSGTILLSAQTVANGNANVTAVGGESWLAHLHRTFDETSMGKTGRLGPAAPVSNEPAVGIETRFAPASQTVSLSGADLYRLNCRGCHGESGHGAPPEINSVINPVRSTSTLAIMARMKAAGLDMTPGEAQKLAEQSKAALRQRLHDGGQDMPAFSHLSKPEEELLIRYLNQLADVPGAVPAGGSLRESPLRVGELIVKSTCHTCHSATGENPTPRELSDGAIPPLSALPLRTSRAGLIRKVTQGAPILMEDPPLLFRGRMPVFYYFSEEEAGDVYQYLLEYPPVSGTSERVIAAQNPKLGLVGPPSPGTRASLVSQRIADTQPASSPGIDMAIVMPVSSLLVFLLLGGGVGLTLHEMKRLAHECERREFGTPLPLKASETTVEPDLVA